MKTYPIFPKLAIIIFCFGQLLPGIQSHAQIQPVTEDTMIVVDPPLTDPYFDKSRDTITVHCNNSIEYDRPDKCKTVNICNNKPGKIIIKYKCDGVDKVYTFIIRNPGYYVRCIKVPMGSGGGAFYLCCDGEIKRERNSVECIDSASIDTTILTNRIRSTSNLMSDLKDNSPTKINHAQPNPFNDQFTIYFDSPEGGNTTITIHDQTGSPERKISIFARKGSNTVQINGKNLSRGIHYVRIIMNNKTKITKILRL